MNPSLQPNVPFQIVQQLLAFDTNTYYIQSVVRQNGVILATINLTNNGGQRFTGNFTPPADIQGNGYYLDITSTVYTDAGYTAISQNYDTWNNVYLVIATISTASLGGGDSTDYLAIRDIIRKEVALIVAEIKFPTFKQKKVDFTELKEHISALVGNLDTETDFSPIHERLSQLHEAIINFPKPEPQKEVDFSPIMNGLNDMIPRFMEISSLHEKDHKELKEHISKEHKETHKKISDISEDTGNNVRDTIEKMRGDVFTMHVMPREKKKEEVKKDPVDWNRIAKLLPKSQ